MSQSDYDGGGSPERSGDGGGEVALRKGPWTKEEDEILMNYVKEKGIAKWSLIGKQTGLARSGKSCRLRWLNHLRPNLKKGCFTKEEQNLILQLHSQYGNKWTRIASKLPGRTDNEIKNFWNTRVKRCNKRQLPLYSETMEEEEDHSPVINACCNFNSNFCIDNLDNNSAHLYQILQSTSCAPAQTHLMSHSWSLQQLQSPTYLSTQYVNSTSVDSSVKDPLSQQPRITSHNFPSETRCTSAQQPTSSFLQRPPSSSGYLSSLQQSRPLYQSMQDLCSFPTTQPPTWISSQQKDDESSLAKQIFISHSTHPLIKPPSRSSTECQLSLIPSLDSEHFRHFRRLGGKLPRPLSAPLMSSILTSKEAFSSTFWPKSPNHSSSVSPLNTSSTTQTPTGPTFQLNFPTMGSSDLSLQTSPLSVDMTGPLVSRSFNEPVSPGLSSISNMEPPSIQTISSPVKKYSSVTSLSQLNAQSVANYDLLNAKLQEELANGSWQSLRKDNFSGQNLVEENLLTKHVKTVDSLDDILCKGSMSDKISRTEYINDEYSRKDGILTQSFKTSDSLSSSFDTTNPSSKIRRKEFMNISRERSSLCTQVTNREDIYSETSETAYTQDNILRNDNTISENLEDKNSEREVSSSRLDVDNAILKGDSKNNDLLVKDTGSKDILDTWLTESLLSEELDYTKCIKIEDPLLVESFNLEGDFNLELRDYLFEEGSKRPAITDPCMSDVQSLIKNSEEQIISTSNKQYPVEDEADLFSGQIYKSFPLESGGGDINSSSIRHSAENVEAEDDINNEISNLLENYPLATEIPEWYQTSHKELPAATQHSDEFNNNV